MPKILVVEDSKSLLEKICKILQSESFDVIWAENGAKGLKLATKELPNLIISDISMPKLNGYELLSELKKSATTALIPFIFLTGKKKLPDLRKGMNIGADDYLVKPFNVDELLNVVRSKLKKQQLSKESFDKLDALVEQNEYSLKEASRMAKIGYWRYNNQTDTIIWSKSLHQIYGTDPKKGVPEIDEILNFFTEESKQKLIKATLNLVLHSTSYDTDLQLINTKNEKIWVRNIGEPLYNDQNEVIGRRGVSQDITEQKLARKKIEEAEEMCRLLTDHSNDLICLNEPEGTFKYISPSIKNLLGYEQSEFLGKLVFSIVHKEDLQSFKNALEQKLFSGTASEAFTFRVRHKKGHFIWLEFLSSPVYRNKKISYFVTSARDVTQWVVAKQEIQKYQTSLQELTTEITLIEEKQKKEIAINIHDHLSQSLIISKMRINELKKNPQLKIIAKDLEFIEKHISTALKNSRKITYDLSPPVLHQLGIIDALSWLLEEIEENHKIACRLNSSITTLKLDNVKSILLYRSIQEIINNAVKYANASLITLDLDKTDLGVDILISDNGDGFDTSVLQNHNHSGTGFGLFTVQERLKNIQGKCTIISKTNKGTIVKFFIPLKK
ncbi:MULTISPECIES: response regulator [unclassified Polaribacter]|uniref:hybrid sensor histidine kinase/response regulator n=1 Tax=unclassified Polaribacter TaxID=196858 RepID=UPI0011BDDBDC|nr:MULTISPECIES: response regulator [unclassified Polaribacter]TXD52652.1 response regulator [Polaribacter sp. IC063]TXD60621.1 response regulator [Polaribacter sp. IC066]